MRSVAKSKAHKEIVKHINLRTRFDVDIKNIIYSVVLVDGEKHYNEPGLSQGIVHFADPKTNNKLGFAGVNYFYDTYLRSKDEKCNC